MKTCPMAIVTAAALMVALPARSADAPVPGDLWETTTKMDMPGMGVSMPARTQEACIAKNSNQPPVSSPPDGNCQMTDVTSSGNTTHWKMRCTGKQAMTGEGEITYQGKDSYSGQMQMTMDQGTMTMKMSGKRLPRDCDAGALQRQVVAGQKQAEQSKAQMCADLVSSMQVQYFDGTMPSNCEPKYKADFCKRLSTTEGYDQLASRDKSPLSATTDLEAAGKTCAVDTAALHDKFCKQALAGNSLPYLARNCPDEAAPIAQAQCAGRGFSGGGVAAPYVEFCSTYARKHVMQASGEAAGATAGTAGSGAGAAAPAGGGQQEAPPGKESTIDAGKKALKKIFPF